MLQFSNLAARLSARATGGTGFLEVLDENRFSIGPDGHNSEYAFRQELATFEKS